MSTGSDRAPTRLRVQLTAFTTTRTAINTGFRMIYPFLPVFARGLGVSLQAMALVVTARSILGALSPMLGSIADVRGRKWAMILGLLVFGASFAIVPARPVYAVVFAAFLLSMVGKLIFDPALQAYLGDRVTYARRGLAIAITEVGWSASSLIGIPLVGWWIGRHGWASPFPWLAALAIGGALVLWRLVPSDRPMAGHPHSIRRNFGLLVRHPATIAGLSVGLLSSAGNETVNIMYGAWMEQSFGLKVAALGAATAVLGVAELTGEGTVAAVSDRLGKRRIVGLALGFNAIACFALLGLSSTLTGALIGLFLFYISFEVIIVGSIPLMTQVLPAARATVMATNVAAISLGRALGAAAGPSLFSFGLTGNTTAAAALDVIALIALFGFVHVDEEVGARE
ncbi:MAG: MFS transporter [Anaerolineales bacterium]